MIKLMPRQEVLDELGLDEAFALQAAGLEANPWCAVKMVSDGYIAQEAYR